ncbi:hypothetical protein PR048_018777 [Dryococelus australis]|uniref:Uncharacterized protein n=1 Tax=Dryococelus australis TaxID=614101 RepID=A0ABQ9HDF8_9NEOP|nr:hypothetical protein PR048_018777 [Dryococelus australis]
MVRIPLDEVGSRPCGAGCDRRVSVYGKDGRVTCQFDYGKDVSEKEFTVACCSPSGQAVAFGSYERQVSERSRVYGYLSLLSSACDIAQPLKKPATWLQPFLQTEKTALSLQVEEGSSITAPPDRKDSSTPETTCNTRETWTTPSYHPQANRTERCNQELKKCMHLQFEDDQHHWDCHLPQILFALRRRTIKAIDSSFSQLLLGQIL